MEFSLDTLDRACMLLKGALVHNSPMIDAFSIVFKMRSQEYCLYIGLQDEMVALLSSTSESRQDIQFFFRCNSIAFHPGGTPEWYAISFHETQGLLKTPKLLIAGDEDGARRLLLYSIPGYEVDGEIEFPKQL